VQTKMATVVQANNRMSDMVIARSANLDLGDSYDFK